MLTMMSNPYTHHHHQLSEMHSGTGHVSDCSSPVGKDDFDRYIIKQEKYFFYIAIFFFIRPMRFECNSAH